MSSHQPVVVPVRVTALMVNGAVRDDVRRTDWRRWVPDFSGAPHLSPEPDPLTLDVSRPRTGVTVHWELPLALRNGALGSDGITTYRAVPARWLVVRYSGPADNRAATAWLVQSNCLRDDPSDHTDNSPYAVATSDTDATLAAKRIGRVLPLTGTLTEPGQSAALTAVGPGLPTFCLYQPYNLGVFSLHDDLSGLTGDRRELSYLVMGWYAGDNDDPLAAAGTPAELLKKLGWHLDPAPSGTMRTVCAGTVTGVVWTSTGLPDKEKEEAPPVATDAGEPAIRYGVGESTADGVSALALAYEPSTWGQGDRLRRLQALQYGLLHEFDSASGAAAAQLRTGETRFEPRAGGFVWDFTTPSSAPGKPSAPVRPLPDEERAWLTGTNADQNTHDAAVRALARRQERMYELWWYVQQLRALAKRPSEIRPKLEALLKEVEPKLTTLIGRVKSDREQLAKAKALVRATTPEELAKAVDAEVARLKKLWGRDPKGRPTRTPRPPFHVAREPIVMIKGARAARLLDDPALLPCRLPGDLVAKADGTSVPPVKPEGWTKLPTVIGDRLPSALPDAVLTEFATLDRHPQPTKVTFADDTTADWKTGSADRRVRAAMRGTQAWRQPWTPLLLVWDAEYFAIPYYHHSDPTKKNWEFGPGQYVWRGEGDADDKEATPLTVRGKALLSAHAVHNLTERLHRIAQEAPGQAPDFVAAVGRLADHLSSATTGSDLISQALDGFNEFLTGRCSLVRARPPASVAGLLDGRHTFAPRDLQPVTRRPAQPEILENWVVPPYYRPLRAGQFRVRRMFLVDRFGRGREIIDTAVDLARRPKPARAASVIPDSKTPGKPDAADAVVHVTEPTLWAPHLFHLRPRLPQPVRLGFDAVSRLDDARTALTASSDEQISAWVVPNYFDEALLCMAPDGTLLGELRPTPAGALAFERLHPDAPVLGQASTKHPNLARFLNGLHARTDAVKALQDLVATVEEIRYTIAPYRADSGHPTLRMLGRPLVLIRARLHLEPDADPVVPLKPSRLTADPPTAEYQSYTWPVLLGSAASFTDGLVGYFDQSDYGTLYAVRTPNDPAPQTTYVLSRAKDTNSELALGQSRLVTLLADPWGGVQATSHILPTRVLSVDPDLVTHALKRMDAVFHVGPALGTMRPISVDVGYSTRATVTAFGIPLPVVETGTWSWRRPDSGTLPVTGVDAAARITPESRAHLRTGLLHLKNGLTPR
ncbi:hypothetical protein D0T12_22420 [Actinomadura spongiicola]|uniref:Uncharacterized protein n=1 Tax=Actinomadura spongiicola TaxID=2303421 RepID=A0A372GCU8_9ACTN|nr:hypothetical protein [Actinomadura spongiicola]RFS82959.1 hypothetical protein D0T12_22420 [Actinomadura spongiicola]